MTPELQPPPRRGLIGPFTGRQLARDPARHRARRGRPLARHPARSPRARRTPRRSPSRRRSSSAPSPRACSRASWRRSSRSRGPTGPRSRSRTSTATRCGLADLRGKLVWLNFWATWCPPCQSETPVLRDMDEAYGDKGLAIVGIAVQETTPDGRPGLRRPLRAGLRHRLRRLGRHLRPVQGLRPADPVLHRPVRQDPRGRQRPDDRRVGPGPHRRVAAEGRARSATTPFRRAQRRPSSSIAARPLVHRATAR